MRSRLKVKSKSNHKRSERAGRWAETLAALYLRAKGYRILARRRRGFRGSGIGEIDILAAGRGALIAVEVKRRPSLAEALESVTPTQRQRIERALLSYQAARPALQARMLRFDVIGFAGWRLQHWPNAWQANSA